MVKNPCLIHVIPWDTNWYHRQVKRKLCNPTLQENCPHANLNSPGCWMVRKIIFIIHIMCTSIPYTLHLRFHVSNFHFVFFFIWFSLFALSFCSLCRTQEEESEARTTKRKKETIRRKWFMLELGEAKLLIVIVLLKGYVWVICFIFRYDFTYYMLVYIS